MSGTGSEHRLRGILIMCVGVALLILLELSAKAAAAESVPVGQIVWARFVVHLIFFAILYGPTMKWDLIRTSNPKIQITRSFMLLGMTVGSFLSLKYLQMAQVTVIGFVTPFLVAGLSIFLLGERVGRHRWTAIIVGFLGVLVVIRPGLGGLHWSMLILLAGLVSYAFYLVLTRKIAGQENPVTSVFYTALVGAIAATLPIPWIWETPGSTEAWIYMLMTGIFGGLAHFLIIRAHKHAPASLLAPFYYTQIVWSVMAGFLFFGDQPDRYTLIGAGIIIASGLYLMARERRKRR